MAKPIALQLYSIREQITNEGFDAYFPRLAQMGYAGVEFAGFNENAVADVKAQMQAAGLTAASAHQGAATEETIADIAETARILGISTVVSGFGPNFMETEQGVNECIEKFAKAVELLKGVGLKLAMHNHWWEFSRVFNGVAAYDMIMTAVPDIQSELDIYWASKAGADCVSVIEKYSDRIPFIHVKDGTYGDAPEHTALGEGKVELEKILKVGEPICDWLIVEIDNCEGDMVEAVEKSAKWLLDSGFGTSKA